MRAAGNPKPQSPKSDQGSVGAPEAGSAQKLPAGQGADPKTLDQENAKEQELDSTVDKGEADQRVKE